MRILVCDDIPERGAETIAAIADGNRGHETFPAFGRQLRTLWSLSSTTRAESWAGHCYPAWPTARCFLCLPVT